MTVDWDTTTLENSRQLPSLASGLLRHVVVALALLFAAMFFTPSKAEAHALHNSGAVAEAAGDIGMGDASTTSGAAECETFCCSPATCASALLSMPGHAYGLTTLAAQYALPADTRAEAQPPTALKRPPRY